MKMLPRPCSFQRLQRKSPFLTSFKFQRLSACLGLWHSSPSLKHITQTLLYLFFQLPPSCSPLMKDPCDHIEPIRMIQDNLSISRSLIQSTFARSLLSSKVTYYQVLESGCRHGQWGGHHFVYHTILRNLLITLNVMGSNGKILRRDGT